MQEPKLKHDTDHEIDMDLTHGDFDFERPQGDVAFLNEIQNNLNKAWRLP